MRTIDPSPWGLPSSTRIIDCHAHFGYFEKTKVIANRAGSMLAAMDRVGVEKLCVSSFLSIGPDCQTGNDMVAELLRNHPDRFIGYAVVNPNREDEIETELDRCFDQLGMKAIKLHPVFHQYPVNGPAYKRVFEHVADEHAIILGHEWGSPEFLDKLGTRYPKTRFILAHTGFWDGRTEFPYAEVLTGHENLFVDLAYSNILYDVVERLVARVGANKVLFGSDFPLHDFGYQLGRIIFAKLSDQDKRLILGGNMLRILGE